MSQNHPIYEVARQKILLLDGAMGTMIQRLELTESDFIFDSTLPHYGCNELLNLSRAELIYDIHLSYLEAGADIIETNTFGAHPFTLKEYHLEQYTYDINLAAAEIAKAATENYRQRSKRPLFVAGVLGPTKETASLSSRVDDLLYRNYSFDQFVASYETQIRGLLEGGVDLLLIETVFDTLIAKAALVAAHNLCPKEMPIMVSATFSDGSGRTLSGQSVEAFIDSLSHGNLFSLGINCSTGPEEMLPLIRRVAADSPFRVSLHPNAGFPDESGNYRQTPAQFVSLLEPLLKEGVVDIIGGCCGTTPAHIASLAEIIKHYSPPNKRGNQRFRLCGLNSLSDKEFYIIGERANVAGSKRFATLIKNREYQEALNIVLSQVEQGADVIDICMDDPLLDAKEEMVNFLRTCLSDPTIAQKPIMVDSSDWSVVEVALKEIQGRAIVNSISLKEGEEPFLEKARTIHSLGAAMVVMLFDERGQGDTFERKIEIAQRAYSLLVDSQICSSYSIVFDPNILTIATGIEEHDYYAHHYLEATKWIKKNLPNVKVCGGVSNLSFSFRGNNGLRRAMHAQFLELSQQYGLDFAIVDPASLIKTSSIPPQLHSLLLKVLLAKGDVSSNREKLVTYAQKPIQIEAQKRLLDWRTLPVSKRLTHAIIIGDARYLKEDLKELETQEPLSLIEGPLMEGMIEVGTLFGERKLYLPQVIQSARVMKIAVDILQPRLEATVEKQNSKGVVVLATVKGDVHDIGKNILSLVLQCNAIEVIDLGVMVPPEKIVETVKSRNVDIVGLSALISPSLFEIEKICRIFNEQGFTIPILVGGATTSEEHTALKLEPFYPNSVIYSPDASDGVLTSLKLLSEQKEEFLETIKKRYSSYKTKKREGILSYQSAYKKAFIKERASTKAKEYGIFPIRKVTLLDLNPFINWRMLTSAWKVPYSSDEGSSLIAEAKEFLFSPKITKLFNSSLTAIVALFETIREGQESITLLPIDYTLHFLRSQRVDSKGFCRSVADYIHPTEKDTIGLFIASSGIGVEKIIEEYQKEGDEYHHLLLQTIANIVVEAFSGFLHKKVKSELWPLSEETLIRPAIGYPMLPDHRQKVDLFTLLEVTDKTGITLTEGYAMKPLATVCGFYVASEGASYYSAQQIGKDQLLLYADSTDEDIVEVEKRLSLEVIEEVLHEGS